MNRVLYYYKQNLMEDSGQKSQMTNDRSADSRGRITSFSIQKENYSWTTVYVCYYLAENLFLFCLDLEICRIIRLRVANYLIWQRNFQATQFSDCGLNSSGFFQVYQQ